VLEILSRQPSKRILILSVRVRVPVRVKVRLGVWRRLRMDDVTAWVRVRVRWVRLGSGLGLDIIINSSWGQG
jgi:hypothetical protein